MRSFVPFAAALLLVLIAVPAAAEVYRWVDAQGVTHYGDKPPKDGMAPVELPPLQTYTPNAAAPAAEPPATADTESGASARAGTATLRIIAPTPDETIRNPEGRIAVSVDAVLQDGDGLLFFLDGVQQNAKPTPSTAWLFEGVERGEHQIGASWVDRSGRERSRAPSITVHMKPPMVLPAR